MWFQVQVRPLLISEEGHFDYKNVIQAVNHFIELDEYKGHK